MQLAQFSKPGFESLALHHAERLLGVLVHNGLTPLIVLVEGLFIVERLHLAQHEVLLSRGLVLPVMGALIVEVFDRGLGQSFQSLLVLEKRSLSLLHAQSRTEWLCGLVVILTHFDLI